jgi:iron-sulfur cluster assembly protein
MRVKMLNITASAKRHLKTKCIWANKKYVLLDLKPSGCAGFEYTWDYCDGLPLVFTLVDDLVVVGEAAQTAVHGSTVDYHEELMGSSLTINNPNIQDACGCGVSFTV